MRVLIVEDHKALRGYVCHLLSSLDGVEICGEAADGREAIEKARLLRPDIITMDLSLPDRNGLEATKEILKILPAVQVIILSQHNVPRMIAHALSVGASGYIVKSEASTTLVNEVKRVRDDHSSRHF